MTHTKRISAVAGMMLAAATTLSAGVLGVTYGAQQAQAVPSWGSYQQKVQDHEDLKGQLSGVNAQLADQILKLNDLTENQIPAAQKAAQDSQQQAQQASDLAQATGERLDAAKKDRVDLETKIKQTGADYDDAKQAVAKLARDSFHGSNASEVMDVVTNAKTTDEFVGKMQSDAAVTRSENNAADDAANTLSTSKSRKDRLSAIEQQITHLKQQSDEQAAQAQQAAQDAQAKQAQLNDLRDQGTAQRESLSKQQGDLTSQSAREAAQIVEMKSQIDSYNQQVAAAAAAASAQAGVQQQLRPTSNGGGSPAAQSSGSGGGSNGGGSSNSSSSSSNNTGSNSGGGSAVGMNYGVPGGCPEGSGFCYGHSTGNSIGGGAYPSRQCTLWAYLRRSQLGLPVGSYMGNGGQWANTARGLGYLVNNTPHVGAAMVFTPGQSVGGHWTADWSYGHVAVVERVNGDGSVLISEGGTGFASFPAYDTIYGAGNYQYIHY